MSGFLSPAVAKMSTTPSGATARETAASSAAFLSSRSASGRPLTKSTTSGRRVCRFSLTEAFESGEDGLLDHGFSEGGHLVSHNARSGTAKNPSPKLAVISPS